jgi:hypothetical protein
MMFSESSGAGRTVLMGRQQRGASALIVVMLLFFMMMLVTAYANRSMVFEQRTSANQYRATQAFEAAEAGLDWAVSLLNAGRVNASCQPSSLPGDLTFVDRYLISDADTGIYQPIPNPTPVADADTVRPGCVRTADNLGACACPQSGGTPLAAPTEAGAFPAFTVELAPVLRTGSTEVLPGVVRVIARGCSGVDPRCVPGATTNADAYAETSVIVALARGLSSKPPATVTVRGGVNLPTGSVRIVNQDEGTNGVTINAGGDIATGADPSIFSRPGTPAEASIMPADESLAALDDDAFFRSYFGVDAPSFSRMPGVTRVACAGDCTGALGEAVASGGYMFWVDGALQLTSAMSLGTPDRPVMIVANGPLQFAGAVQVHGIVYGHSLDWGNTGPDDAFVRGAVILRDDCCTGSGTPVLVYDSDVLNRLYTLSGSFARVNGSWKDY